MSIHMMKKCVQSRNKVIMNKGRDVWDYGEWLGIRVEGVEQEKTAKEVIEELVERQRRRRKESVKFNHKTMEVLVFLSEYLYCS